MTIAVKTEANMERVAVEVCLKIGHRMVIDQNNHLEEYRYCAQCCMKWDEIRFSK